jgi:hypothetical protein
MKLRNHVVLQLDQDGTAIGHILFDAPTVEKHIQDVAEHRAALTEQVVPDLDPGSRLKAVFDPAWRISNQKTQHGRILALRHPGIGWLSFVLPDKEAAAMAEWLLKDLPQSKFQ